MKNLPNEDKIILIILIFGLLVLSINGYPTEITVITDSIVDTP